MMNLRTTLLSGLLPLLLIGGFMLTAPSCSAPFDQTALDNAINLKIQTADLMNKAVNPYNDFNTQVDQLMGDLNKARDHAAGLKNNKEITEAWNALINEVVTPFFNKWQKDGSMNQVFINESVRICESSFDAIKTAEQAKQK